MKSISSNRDRDAACGFHQRIRTQSYFITPREKAWGTSERSASGTADWLFRRQSERFNGETFWEFLRHLREATVEPGRRVILISDNAPYHRSRLHLAWRQQQQPQFALDFLPPYSPELNPIERVWKLTRRLCLHNRYFAFLDSVAEAVEGQLANWLRPNETLRRLCANI